VIAAEKNEKKAQKKKAENSIAGAKQSTSSSTRQVKKVRINDTSMHEF